MTSTGEPRPAPVPDLLVGLAAAVPAPRPELLIRVLEGLRELPDAPAGPASLEPVGTDRAGHGDLPPLPRRRA